MLDQVRALTGGGGQLPLVNPTSLRYLARPSSSRFHVAHLTDTHQIVVRPQPGDVRDFT